MIVLLIFRGIIRSWLLSGLILQGMRGFLLSLMLQKGEGFMVGLHVVESQGKIVVREGMILEVREGLVQALEVLEVQALREEDQIVEVDTASFRSRHEDLQAGSKEAKETSEVVLTREVDLEVVVVGRGRDEIDINLLIYCITMRKSKIV